MPQKTSQGAAVQVVTNTQAPARQSRTTTPAASNKLFLKGEMPAEFFALLRKAFERYLPTSGTDAHLVCEATRAAWMFLRHSRARQQYETKLLRRQPDPATWTTAETAQLDTLRICHHRARRTLLRHLKNARPLLRSKATCHIADVQQLFEFHYYLFDLEAFPYDFGTPR